MDKKIQIVNDQNQVIGANDKQTAHTQGLWHRIVCVYVFNEQGQLFIQQRNVKHDVIPHLWDHSVAGHVDEGEEPLVAAYRELREELGIETKLTLLSTFQAQEKIAHKTLNRFWYLYSCHHNGPFHLDPEEILTGRFITLIELKKDFENHPDKFALGFHRTWKKYLELNKI